ncbi:MAG: hypothetical protein C0492_03850 [Verminephrobacter sp.]|nr:hypothetical protein [Verminephrobacter sp.]
MSTPPAITIVQPNPDGSLPIPAPSAPSATEAAAAQLQQRAEALQEQLEGLQELLAKPLNEILADRDKALEAAAAWDAFGAMWVLSQRAMRRVAVDLAAQQGVSEAEVVARAMQHANAVLNSEDETLGGTIAPAQLAHIARHKPFLRKQFRQG